MKIEGKEKRVLSIKLSTIQICLFSIIRHPYNKIKKIAWLYSLNKEYCHLIRNKLVWKRLFLVCILGNDNTFLMDTIHEFYTSDIRLVKQSESIEELNGPVVVCALRNEMCRLKELIEHYRRIGVNKFIFADNNSDDGSFEYLMSQNDVTVYRVTAKYNARRKAAWINRMIDDHGLNRWYITIDADEFLEYKGMKTKRIGELISKIERKKLVCLKGIMINLYPKAASDLVNIDSFVEEYKYYDRNSDDYVYRPALKHVYGGVNHRLTGKNWVIISKTPLIFANGKVLVLNSHEIWPKAAEHKSYFGCILLHYKFLPGESDRIKEIALNENYADGSALYKIFRKQLTKDGMSLFCDCSTIWRGDESIDEFELIK